MMVGLIFFGGLVAALFWLVRGSAGLDFGGALATVDPRAVLSVGAGGKAAIGYSSEPPALHLMEDRGGVVRCRTVPAAAVVASAVYEDGESVTTSSMGRTVAGAAVGAVLLGGAGGVVGGLSGRRRTAEQVSEIELRITVDDPDEPLFAVPFLAVPCARSSELYRLSSAAARTWHGRAEVLMKRAAADGAAGARAIRVRRIAPPDPPVLRGRRRKPGRMTKAYRAELIARARAGARGEKKEGPVEHRLDR